MWKIYLCRRPSCSFLSDVSALLITKIRLKVWATHPSVGRCDHSIRIIVHILLFEWRFCLLCLLIWKPPLGCHLQTLWDPLPSFKQSGLVFFCAGEYEFQISILKLLHVGCFILASSNFCLCTVWYLPFIILVLVAF